MKAWEIQMEQRKNNLSGKNTWSLYRWTKYYEDMTCFCIHPPVLMSDYTGWQFLQNDRMWETTCQQIFLGPNLNEDSLFVLYVLSISSAESHIFISKKWKYNVFDITRKGIRSQPRRGPWKYEKKKKEKKKRYGLRGQ